MAQGSHNLPSSGGGVGPSGSTTLAAEAAEPLPAAVVSGTDNKLITDLYRRLRIVEAAYDSLSAADRTLRTNPKWMQNFEDILVDETDMADGTYPYYFTPTEYSIFSFKLDLDGGAGGTGIVVTLEGTTDVGVAMTACYYEDITADIFSVLNWTVIAGGTLLLTLVENEGALKGYTHCRFVVTPNSVGPSADYRIDLKMGVI